MLGFDKARNERVAAFEAMKQTPIGDIGRVDGWKTHPIAMQAPAFNEPLVPIGAFSAYDRIFTDSIYAGEHAESSPYGYKALNGSLLSQFVRKGVADKLVAAADMLPEGYELMVWDAYRPLSVQQSLYEHCLRKIMQNGQGLSLEAASAAAQKLVSIPSTDPTKPSPHNTGGSVDVTIIQFEPEAARQLKNYRKELSALKARGKDTDREYELEMKIQHLFRTKSEPLNMGVRFDEDVAATPMCHFEERLARGEVLNEDAREALENRRALAHIMRAVGFSVYEHEPWHFDSGNQFDAVKRGTPALYGAASLSEENIAHEKMRVMHFEGTRAMQEKPRLLAGIKDPDAVLARRMAQRTSEVDAIASHPMAQQL